MKLRSLPEWMLRLLGKLSPTTETRQAIALEWCWRLTEEAIEETADERCGPWRVAPPEGMV